MTNSEIYTAIQDARAIIARALIGLSSGPAKDKVFHAYQFIGREANKIEAELLNDDSEVGA